MYPATTSGMTIYDPLDLMSVARAVRAVYDNCAAQNADLFGGSMLDLAADNIPDVSLADLKLAIVVSGIEAIANERIRKQIGGYR